MMCGGRGVPSLSRTSTPEALSGAQVIEPEVLGYWAVEMVEAGPHHRNQGPPLGLVPRVGVRVGFIAGTGLWLGGSELGGGISVGEVTELGSRSGLRLGLVSG